MFGLNEGVQNSVPTYQLSQPNVAIQTPQKVNRQWRNRQFPSLHLACPAFRRIEYTGIE